jgi:hypothetical protein
MRRWQPRTLAGTFLVLQLAVVALVLLVAAIVSVRQAQAQFRGYAAERILGAAESLATNPLVRERVLAPTAATDLAPVAESVRIQSGASSVLVAGLDRRIVAASDPTLVGSVLVLPDDAVWSGRPAADLRGRPGLRPDRHRTGAARAGPGRRGLPGGLVPAAGRRAGGGVAARPGRAGRDRRLVAAGPADQGADARPGAGADRHPGRPA